jgi:transcriptional regulator with XRE-family HTH domain
MPNSISGQNMTRIDGKKIRRIREQKGLTQLYLATVVGVTTDTISRWENRRYPSIKQENGVKLAEALEVELEEILETNTTPDQDEAPEETQKQPPSTDYGPIEEGSRPQRPRPLVGLVILLILFLIGGGIWWFLSRPAPVSVDAVRNMPPHVPAGEIFPVVVQISTDRQESFSLLLKETIPAGFVAEKSNPTMTTRNGSGILKWVSRTSGSTTTFTYLVRAPEDTLQNHQYGFEGVVTLGKEKKSTHQVGGNSAIEVANFHWADINQDNVIDDEEILTAYDSFNGLDELAFNWDRVDEIWTGQGYRWDSNSRQYIIIP